MTRRGLLAAAVLAAAACGAERGAIRIDGSPGVAPLIRALAREHMMLTTDSVTMGAGLGSRARLDAVQQGTIDIAMASHGVDSADLRERGLVAHEVARTAVVFAVNASVPVTDLAREQLCDIYSGRKPAWQLFGAPPPAGAIAPFMRPANEVDAEVALEGIACLRDVQLGGYVSIRERADEMAQAIVATPGAIGLTSMTYVQHSGVGGGGTHAGAGARRRGADGGERCHRALPANAPRDAGHESVAIPNGAVVSDVRAERRRRTGHSREWRCAICTGALSEGRRLQCAGGR